MYTEDELLPISALQHLMFCERQWGLIYLEGLWQENVLTARGGLLHDRVDLPGVEARPGGRMVYGLALRSLRLGLVGRSARGYLASAMAASLAGKEADP